jgi:hypothetical protein
MNLGVANFIHYRNMHKQLSIGKQQYMYKLGNMEIMVGKMPVVPAVMVIEHERPECSSAARS